MRTANSVWIHGRVFSLLALLSLFVASCSVLFVSPYDEVTDRAATELVTKTEIFIVGYAATTDETGHIVRRGKPFDAEAATLYTEARGAAAAMLLRSEQKDKNDEEIQILRNLSTRYDQLEASHRLGSITKNSAAGLQRTLRALVQVQLIKKRLATSQQASSAGSSSP
jgi:hypothetical protein